MMRVSMSFQRMLEMARRHGMPIVVTDPNGKEPMVVLSLEIYEALLNETSHATRVTPHASSEGMREPIMVPVRDGSSSTPKQAEAEPENLAELSMEERFYMEPLDEPRNT